MSTPGQVRRSDALTLLSHVPFVSYPEHMIGTVMAPTFMIPWGDDEPEPAPSLGVEDVCRWPLVRPEWRRA